MSKLSCEEKKCKGEQKKRKYHMITIKGNKKSNLCKKLCRKR